MANYYDPDLRKLKPILYTWSTGATWDDLIDWHIGDGGAISSVGVPDIEYFTAIEDFGRVADINPLCTVNAVGEVVIKVYAATSIDSSSLLPGDPVIDTSDSSQDPQGVRARYFQFKVEVFTLPGEDLADTSISRVVTKLKATQQTEYIQGDSSSHSGTVDQRIAPITQNYSKISSLIGTAEYTDTGTDSAGAVGLPYANDDYVSSGYFVTTTADSSEIPVVIVRDLTDRTQPKYAVFTTNGTNRDHYVYLQVSGLPRMQVTAQGNIVEQ